MPGIEITVHHTGCPIDGCRCPEALEMPLPSRDLQVSVAVGVLASRLRYERHGAWGGSSDSDRRSFARRALRVRLRLNLAGLMRWRREPAEEGSRS